jgi:hypothetical protein
MRLEKKLLANGREAKAEVLAARPTINSITGTGGFPLKALKWHLSLRVAPVDEPQFDIDFAPWLKGGFMPSVGLTVDVLYDPGNHSQLVVDPRKQDTIKDMLAVAQQQQSAIVSAFAASQQQAGGSGRRIVVLEPGGQIVQAGGQAAPAADPVDQLQKLVDLRDRGALSEDEFVAEKSKILEA